MSQSMISYEHLTTFKGGCDLQWQICKAMLSLFAFLTHRGIYQLKDHFASAP